MGLQEIDLSPPGPRIVSNGHSDIIEALNMPPREFREVYESLARPPLSVRLWRSLRKLIRRRQESQVVKDAKLEAVKAKRDAAKQVADIAQKMLAKDNQIKELEGRLATKAREVSRLEDHDKPILKDKIAVLEAEIRILGALNEKNLAREKAAIAVYNERIVGRDEVGEWQRRMMGE